MERVGWRDEGRDRGTKRERKEKGSERDLEEVLIVFP